jgi:hypothetical protein
LDTNSDPIAATTLSFDDITENVQTVDITRGRSGHLDDFSPGTCTVTLAITNVSGGVFSYGATIPPRSIVRVSMLDSTYTRRYLFTGFVMLQGGVSWQFHGSRHGTLTLRAEDALGHLARVKLSDDFIAWDLAGYPTDVLADWQASFPEHFPAWATLDVDLGTVIMQAVDGSNALDVIKMLFRSEGGAFYIAGDGDLYGDGRHAPYIKTRLSTSQETFDTSGADPRYAVDWTVEVPPTFNKASVSMLGSDTVFEVQDDTAIATYGEMAYPPITGAFMADGAQARGLADFIVETSKIRINAIRAITVYPQRDNTHLDACIQRELRDRITVNGMGVTAYHVEQITHRINAADRFMSTTLGLSSRDQFYGEISPTAASQWLLLDGTTGILDGTKRLAP